MSVACQRFVRCVVAVMIVLSLAALNVRLSSAGDAASMPVVTFTADRTTLWLGSTSVVPFRVASPVKEDVTLSASFEPADAGAVVISPRVLAGHTLGFVRVRPLKQGKATLVVGGAKLPVETRVASMEAELFPRRPVIVGPAQLAAVWGKVTLGVEHYFDPLDPASAKADEPPAIELKLATGESLGQAKPVPLESAPIYHYVFELDADKLPTGPARVVAVTKAAAGPALTSDALTLNVIRGEKVVAGACIDTLDMPRPKRAGEGKVKLISDPSSSGGKAVLCASAEPAWCVAFDAPVAGVYQMMVVARGDFGGGAFPTVGMMIGEKDQPASASRLVDTRWHRAPVGLPIALPAGKAALSARFLNDFNAPDFSDRNLYLDRYEIALVAAGAVSETQGGGMMMAPGNNGGGGGSMMMGGATQAMGGAPAMGTSGGNASMQSMLSMAGDGAMMSMGPNKLGDDGAVRVAFARPMHDQPLRGDMTISGFCAWPNARATPAPRVSLVINGKPLMTHRADEPVFKVNPGYFAAGRNRVQLVATTDAGVTGVTPVQVIHVDASALAGATPRAYRRFSADDDAWGATTKGKLSDKDRLEGHRHARVTPGAPISLTLPEDVSGPQEIWLDGRLETASAGSTRVTIALKTPDAEKKVAEVKVFNWFYDWKQPVVELPRGPKQLVVSWAGPEDKSREGKDAAVHVKAVSLREPPAGEDRETPKLTLLYPNEGQMVYMADAIVFEACDNDQLAWVDVLIDGKRLGELADVEQGWGRLTLPLLSRQLTPGKHTLRLRAEDRSGNQADSREITFNVLAQPPAELTQYERAVRVLNRFAYGPDSDELAAILVEGERGYLESRLSRTADEPGDAAAAGRAGVFFPKADYYHEIANRVVTHLQLTDNPVRTRFVQWTENHFSVWLKKAEGWRKWQEHAAFSRMGAAPFGELLETSAGSTAMLVYLDQQRSFATRLNENYAREILELHTVGVRAGYTQADVTSLASVLNGWTVAEEAPASGRGFPIGSVFRYDPALNDGQSHRVFGVEYRALPASTRFDNVRVVIETLASHPSTAEHVSAKLVEHYVASPAPEAMVKDIAAEFRRTGGDMRAVLLAIAAHPQFMKRDLPSRVARPIDYAARLSRCTRSDDHWQVVTYLDKSGMGVFDCVTPNGFSEDDEKYADSNAVLQRWRLAKHHEWRLSTMIPNAWRWSIGADPQRWRQNVIDALAVRLTGSVLGEQSNAAALNVLAGRDEKGNERPVPKPGTDGFNEWIQQASAFVASLPEASLR